MTFVVLLTYGGNFIFNAIFDMGVFLTIILTSYQFNPDSDFYSHEIASAFFCLF